MTPRAETLEQLFTRFLAEDDEAALATLFRRSAPPLRQFAVRLCLPADRREELVHETLVTAVQRADTFEPSAPLLPWLVGILARKAAAYHRDEARRRRHHAALAERAPADHGTSDPVVEDELRELLADAIAGLPTRYREVVGLHLQHGLTPAEIATRLGRARVTVRVHLHRGLQLLRRRLPRGLLPCLLVLGLCGGSVVAASADVALRAGRRAVAGAIVVGAAALATLPLVRGPAMAAVGAVVVPDARPAAAATTVAEPGHVERARGASVVAAAELRVVVRDGAGHPLPNVGITVEPAAGLEPLPHRRRAVSGPDGVVAISGLGSWPRRLRSDRGHDQLVGADASTVELRAAGDAVDVQVLDADERPLAGIGIWVASGPGLAGHGGDVGSTGVDGWLRLGAVPRGALVGARGDGAVAVPVAVPGPGSLRLRVVPAVPLRGRVVGGDGRPLAGAVVAAGEAPEHAELGFPDGVMLCRWPVATDTSAADGSFGPLWLPAGAHTVHVRAAGHVPGRANVMLEPDLPGAVTIGVHAARTAHGVVRSSDGQPLPSAQLVFRTTDRDHRIDLVSAADGGFAFALPDCDGVLATRADGHEPRSLPLPAGAVPPRLDVALSPRARHAVSVRCGDAVAAHWQLRVRTPPRSILDRTEHVIRVDEHGRGELPLSARALAVAAVAVRGPGDPVWHEVDGAAALATGFLVLPAALAPTASVHGSCRAAGGAPIAAARVFLRCDRGVAWEAAATDADGRFVVGHLAPGNYFVFAESRSPQHPCVLAHDVAIAGATALALQAGPSGTLTFALRRAGVAPSGAMVTVVGGAPARRYLARAAAAGEQVLPVGDYTFHAFGEDFAWLDGVPFRIEAERTTTLRCDVEPAVRTAIALRGDLPPLAMPFSLRLRRRDDDRAFGSFQLLPEAMPAVTAFLPIGDYELHAADDRGEPVAAGSLRIDSLVAQPSAHVVWLAAGR